jgi:hypothetical protein
MREGIQLSEALTGEAIGFSATPAAWASKASSPSASAEAAAKVAELI